MLKEDSIIELNGVTIKQKIMPSTCKASKMIASWVKRGGLMKPNVPLTYGITGVTIHNTGDLVSMADDAYGYVAGTYNENMGGVVVHYYVDDLGGWQLLDDHEAGWHASDGSGRGNYGTIAIECIMGSKAPEEDEKAETNAVKLAAYLLDKYGLTIDNLYTHNHWMGLEDKIVAGAKKNCPYYILPHWKTFKARVEDELKRLQKNHIYKVCVGCYLSQQECKAVAKQLRGHGFRTTYYTNGNLYFVQIGAFKVRNNAVRYEEKAKILGYNTCIL